MPDIVLATLNAKYIHAAFGLRYLLANMAELQETTALLEFDINQRPLDIAENIIASGPKILGLAVYIWNVAPTTELVRILKSVRPNLTIILGGPEVSYETEDQSIIAAADFVITGEADLALAEVCRQILAGHPPRGKVMAAEMPQFSQLHLPYDLYAEADLAHRVVYVEASRGCPFSCEFCLSSLDIPVRQAPLETLLPQLDALLQRGARHLKFVDRTFNVNLENSRRVLEFCLERYQPGRFFHFEMVPDRLPEQLRGVIARFPAGALQLEVGIQTFNPTAAELISRRQDYARLEDNLRFLRQNTGVHIHADLIAGLPGEDLASFAAGFDRLVALQPHEIQLGLLKRLRGTPITRHTAEWGMVYNLHAPYELLQNRLVDFQAMQALRRFARYWDLVANSGNFLETTPLLWAGQASAFSSFAGFSQWLYRRVGRTDSIALVKLMQLLFEYLTAELRIEETKAAEVLWRDYQRTGRKDKPEFLRDFLPANSTPVRTSSTGPGGLKRQARHQARP